MYGDVEKIREIEEEAEKDQNSKLSSAGMMAFLAGATLLASAVFSGLLQGISPELFGFLQNIGLPIIGFGALGYGMVKMLRMVFRQKLLNFPALNVYRKTKVNPAEEYAAQQNPNYRATQQRRSRVYQPDARKTMRRSRNNRVFSGVAGGIAEYTGVPPALIRFGFIASLFMAFPLPVFVYLMLSIVLPANYDRGEWEQQRRPESATDTE
jgi:phage shock protein PspC (stress-responsive transcriptional regulator)